MSTSPLLRDSSRTVTLVAWPDVSSSRFAAPLAGAAPPAQQHPQPEEASAKAPVPEPPDPAILEQVAREAFERGARETKAALQKEMAAQMQPLLERMSNMLSSLATQRALIRRESEVELVRLAVEVARRILNREIAVDPLSLQGVVKAALEKLDRCETSQVRVNPSDVATLESCLERLNPSFRPAVAGDASLPAGSILFQTNRGTVDASIQTQLKEIERGFADRLGF